MRIIDHNVTGNDLKKVANQFYLDLCPKIKSGERYNAQYFSGQLEKLADSSNKKKKYYRIFKFLYDNLETIITGTPAQLEKFNSDFLGYLKNENIEEYLEKTLLKRKIRKIFLNAYENFRYNSNKGDLDKWFDSLNLKTCPYCNRMWTTKVLHNDGCGYTLYFDVDHFWPKDKFPWLAISFFNLIPSCTICNQRIKRNTELDPENHIHPYRDDLHSYLKFSVPINETKDFFDSNSKISLMVIPRPPYTEKHEMYIKAKNTLIFFNLDNLYNTHLDYVRELMQRDIIYSKKYVDSLLHIKTEAGVPVFNDIHDLLKMLSGNYVLSKDIHQRPLAKLTQDILEDFNNRNN